MGYCCLERTMSLEHVDRGSMHLVEHQDDLFSWKKNNNYTYAATVCGKEIKKISGIAWKTWWTTRYTSVKYSSLTLTAGRCSVTSRMSKGYLTHTSSIAPGSLHTAGLSGTQSRAGLGLGCTPLSHIKGTVPPDFSPLVFFFKQLLLAPVDKPSNDFDFFRIFADIFDFSGASPVSLTPAKQTIFL